ncbi:MAG: hypothetical protein OJF49_001520 [Ktedonobacterales bacterium]|nr:MAG: hypothetical protein OJF49_001520 [Ktedonobacterales bacterium]
MVVMLAVAQARNPRPMQWRMRMLWAQGSLSRGVSRWNGVC